MVSSDIQRCSICKEIEYSLDKTFAVKIMIILNESLVQFSRSGVISPGAGRSLRWNTVGGVGLAANY